MISYELYAKLRNDRCLTDSKVSSLAGFGRSTFSDWKSGRSKPKADKLEKIRIVLGINPDEWMRIQGIEQPDQYGTDLILSKLGISVEDFQLLREIAFADPEIKEIIIKLLNIYKSK